MSLKLNSVATVTYRHPFRLRMDRPEAQLRILATTDLHFQLTGWDYLADRPSPATGLSRAAALVRALRGAVANSLLFDNGDFLQGSPLSDWVADRRAAGESGIHPMIQAMNALGYDAVTLGNHEFNYGLPFLTESLHHAAFPVVSANVLDRAGTPLVPPFLLLDREVTDVRGRRLPIRIGVIGLAPPQITLWDGLTLGGAVTTRDMVDTAETLVPALRAAGADIVVLLAHTGIGPPDRRPGMENAALPLAALPGIDALVTGHTHQVFPGPAFPPGPAVDPHEGTLHGTPAVMAGFHGSHVGVIDLHLAHDGTRWHRIGQQMRVMPVTQARPPPDAQIDSLAAVPHSRLLADLRHIVGRTSVPLDTYFSLVAPSLALQVVADAQRARARAILPPHLADLPLISAVAPFQAGGRAGPLAYVDIPAGPLRRRHASELYIYPNRLCVVEVTGGDIADWLDHAAGLFLTLTRGETDQPLIDPAFPAYLFDTLDGLTWEIDPTIPPGSAARVCDIRHDGRPLDPAARMLVVTNGYRAGGGGVPGLRAARIVASDDRGVREAVLDHLAADPVGPVPRPAWRLARHPGTAAWFDTGPAARFRASPPGVTALGHAPDGFHRFRLSLDPAHRHPDDPAP
jgi:2',3'-cyclic-nucleotide 2'-phosphodiesterase/3'-nucleotidase